MLDDLKAGSMITCTVTREPRAAAQRTTIARLMRQDPAVIKGLRRAQKLRKRRMHSYIRGNRLYHSREKCARIARVTEGASWTMPYAHQLNADLRSVSDCLEIKSA